MLGMLGCREKNRVNCVTGDGRFQQRFEAEIYSIFFWLEQIRTQSPGLKRRGLIRSLYTGELEVLYITVHLF